MGATVLLLVPWLVYIWIRDTRKEKKTKQLHKEQYASEILPQAIEAKKYNEFLALSRNIYITYIINGKNPRMAVCLLEDMRRTLQEKTNA